MVSPVIYDFVKVPIFNSTILIVLGELQRWVMLSLVNGQLFIIKTIKDLQNSE